MAASLNEGPAWTIYVERGEFPNQLVTTTHWKGEEIAAGGVDLVVTC